MGWPLFQLQEPTLIILLPGAEPTIDIIYWAGNGNISKNQALRLAPFVDVNNDGFYDTKDGDYPAYDVENKAEKDNLGFCKTKLFGDYTLFWVFNDKGNVYILKLRVYLLALKYGLRHLASKQMMKSIT